MRRISKEQSLVDMEEECKVCNFLNNFANWTNTFGNFDKSRNQHKRLVNGGGVQQQSVLISVSASILSFLLDCEEDSADTKLEDQQKSPVFGLGENL